MKTIMLIEVADNEPARALVEKLMEEINGTIHEVCITDPLTEREQVTITFRDVDEE